MLRMVLSRFINRTLIGQLQWFGNTHGVFGIAPERSTPNPIYKIPGLPTSPAASSVGRTRPQCIGFTVSYIDQLDIPVTPRQPYIPITTPLPPLRFTLQDFSSVQRTLFVAPSRLGHNFDGVFVVCDLPMAPKSSFQPLCANSDQNKNTR